VFDEFEHICARRRAGGDVLEVGAVPADDTLLFLPTLSAARSRVGINLNEPVRYRDVEILHGDANSLQCFADESFDTVVCNSVLEHDPYFWKSVGEVHRVTRPGGLIVIGVPGFTRLPIERLASRLARFLRGVGASRAASDAFDASTLVLRTHPFPGDYYRFSRQAVQQVFLAGLDDTEVHSLMTPPRIIGAGKKPPRFR
jgi:SAM-dependent methyltransferase